MFPSTDSENVREGKVELSSGFQGVDDGGKLMAGGKDIRRLS